MTNIETIHSKTKKLLETFGRKNVHFHFTVFSNQKAGTAERRELRQQLIQKIKNHKDFESHKKDFDWNNLLITGKKPDSPVASISISHCRNLGVFLFTFDKNLSIGFDMEQKKRITEKIVKRVSSNEEWEKAPTPALLWTAKEASFKCLSSNKTPLLLSDCRIYSWKKDPTQKIYFFHCHLEKIEKKAFGSAGFSEDLALAYAEIKL